MFNMKRVIGFGAIGALALFATTSFPTDSQAKCKVNWTNGDCGPRYNAGGGNPKRPTPQGPATPVDMNPYCDHEWGDWSEWNDEKWNKEDWGTRQSFRSPS